MKLVFFGTPDYVIPVLEKLSKYHEIVAVVTQNPKPAGRGKKIEYSAVDTWAHKKKVAKFFNFQNLPQADLGVCAAYGKIIPNYIINGFKYGILNIHPSLLPKYRGASPIQTAISDGDTETGVTIIKMDDKMDHGPIVSSFKEEIAQNDTLETLRIKLFEKSSQFLIDLIPKFSKGKINLKHQDENLATYTKMVKKEDGYIDLKKTDPIEIERKFRAYQPWPGIWTNLQVKSHKSEVTKKLKILKCHFELRTSDLVLDTVQLEGKKPVSWEQFKQAYSLNF